MNKKSWYVPFSQFVYSLSTISCITKLFWIGQVNRCTNVRVLVCVFNLVGLHDLRKVGCSTCVILMILNRSTSAAVWCNMCYNVDVIMHFKDPQPIVIRVFNLVPVTNFCLFLDVYNLHLLNCNVFL